MILTKGEFLDALRLRHNRELGRHDDAQRTLIGILTKIVRDCNDPNAHAVLEAELEKARLGQ